MDRSRNKDGGVEIYMEAMEILSKEYIEDRYLKYLECFNAMDFEGLKKYLDENMYFYRGTYVPPLMGRVAFFQFYKKAWRHFEERLTIGNMKISNRRILIVTLTNHLQVKKDWLDSPYGAFHKGQRKTVSGDVIYVFNHHGKIAVLIDLD